MYDLNVFDYVFVAEEEQGDEAVDSRAPAPRKPHIVNTDRYQDMSKVVDVLKTAYWHHKASERVGKPVDIAAGF